MKTQKGFASVPLIIILAIIVLGGGYLLLKQKPAKESEKAQVPALSCLPTDPPSITVISPNGGETFHIGDNVNIQWKVCNPPSNSATIVLLSSQTNYEDPIIALYTSLPFDFVPSNSNFQWTIPTSLSSQLGYPFKIGVSFGGPTPTGSNEIGDTSNNPFNIFP